MAIIRITTGENSPPQARSGIGDVVNSSRRPRGSAQERPEGDGRPVKGKRKPKELNYVISR